MWGGELDCATGTYALISGGTSKNLGRYYDTANKIYLYNSFVVKFDPAEHSVYVPNADYCYSTVPFGTASTYVNNTGMGDPTAKMYAILGVRYNSKADISLADTVVKTMEYSD